MLVLLSILAHGSAGAVAPASGDVAIGETITLYELRGATVEATCAGSWSGDASSFAWILPFPTGVTGVTVDDLDVSPLAELLAATAPDVRIVAPDAPGTCSCRGGDSDPADTDGESDSVVLDSDTDRPRADDPRLHFDGTVTAEVIPAGAPDDVFDWLDARGYDEALARAALIPYLDDGWVFVALQVVPADAAPTPVPLPVVRVQYNGGEIELASRLAAASTADPQRTTIIVGGDGRAHIERGWTEQILGEVEGSVADGPEAAIDAALLGVGSNRSLAVTYAGFARPQRFYTRFDTLAPAAVHSTDVVVVVDPSNQNTAELVVRLFSDGVPRGSALFLVGLAVVAARRR